METLVNECFELAHTGDLAALKQHLVKGFLVNTQNEKGWTLFTIASYNHHLKLMKFLLDNGANINHQTANGTTALMYAKAAVMTNGNYEILEYLLSMGASINLRDYKKGWTVLQYVKEVGHPEMEAFLAKYGATV